MSNEPASPVSAESQTPASGTTGAPKFVKKEPLRLHIGGEAIRDGWKIFNIQPKPGGDLVCKCLDLSQFADNSITEIYTSHTYEHLDYAKELRMALKEAFRVLTPGGMLRAGVPDLDVLCRLFLEPKLDINMRFHVMRMMFGGQIDE